MSDTKAENVQMVPKWTPGPWKACQDGECLCGQIWSFPADMPVFTVVGDERHLIGLANDEWGDEPKYPYGALGKEAQHANARLIAEAPAMADYTAKKAADGCPEAIALLTRIRGATP